MPYTLTRHDDTVRITFVDQLVQEDIQALLAELTPPELVATAPAVLVLIDARPLKKVDLSARKGLVDMARRRTGKKVAVVGLSPYVRVLTNFINKAAGRDHIRLFDSEADAQAWLQADE